MDDRQMERACLEALISYASNVSGRNDARFFDIQLCLLKVKLRHAQSEVILLSDAIQYLIETDNGKCVPSDCQKQLGTQATPGWTIGSTQPHCRLFADKQEDLFNDYSSDTGGSTRSDVFY